MRTIDSNIRVKIRNLARDKSNEINHEDLAKLHSLLEKNDFRGNPDRAEDYFRSVVGG